MTPPSKPLQQRPEPVMKHTHYQTAAQGLAHHVAVDPCQAAQRRFPCEFILDWAIPVMNNITGETLEHPQLQHHPKYQNNWNVSYSNEMGRLCQGKEKGYKGPNNQRI